MFERTVLATFDINPAEAVWVDVVGTVSIASGVRTFENIAVK